MYRLLLDYRDYAPEPGEVRAALVDLLAIVRGIYPDIVHSDDRMWCSWLVPLDTGGDEAMLELIGTIDRTGERPVDEAKLVAGARSVADDIEDNIDDMVELLLMCRQLGFASRD